MRSGGWQTSYISLYVFQLLELNSTFVFPDGNGFKTSTMWLGVDDIVLSRATSARYFYVIFTTMLVLASCFIFTKFVMGCTQRIVFNCIWLYIFPCRKVQWNVHSLLKTLFYLNLTFYVSLSTCVHVCASVYMSIKRMDASIGSVVYVEMKWMR